MAENIEHGPWEYYKEETTQEHGPWEHYKEEHYQSSRKKTDLIPFSLADRKRVREAFTGDPLGFIADTDVRSYVSSTTENFPDRDEYRKRMALAAYFTAFGGNGNFKFNLTNLDGILESFYKKKISVDSAYADIAQMIAPKKEWLGEKATPAESTWTAHGAALLSGVTDVSAHLAATYLKFAKWGVDSKINSLAPLLPESAVNFLKSYSSDLLESYGQKIYKSGKEISEDLSRVSGANPDFLLDMVQGDFDKVSVSDFTKALVQSAPNMGMQILVAAAAPYALPAFVGAEQVAMKDYEVNEKQPDWSGAKKWTYIGLSAANEALFELVTSKIVGGKLSKKAGAKILQRGMMKFLGLSAAKEGGSEAAQQLLANANDLLFDIEGDSGKLSTQEKFKRMFSGVLESGFVGAIYGLPEGIAGFRNSREFAGVYSEVRNKHEKRVEELSAKENLSDIEKKQLEVSRTILDSADPREAVAVEYINNKIEEISGDEEIRNGFDYAGIERTAADSAEDGDIISAVKAERRNNLRNTSSWSYDDVVDKVSEYSQGFKDTVFHVVENWEDVADKVPADAPGRSFIDLKTGEIYINAQKVRPHEVFEVMLHEVVGHKGLRNIFNDSQLDSLLDQVYSEHFNEEGFKEVARRYFDLTELTDEEGNSYLDVSLEDVKDQRLAAEEYIAYLAQQETKPSWWKEFLQKIRMFFSRLPFFKDVRMTDDEINTVLARSARSVRRGMFDRRSRVETDGNGPERTGTEEVRFSIIGERGAALLDRALKQDNTANLQIAKEMLSAGKDAKTIKLATGWEKGGDGKWRMEIPDVTMKTEHVYGNIRQVVEAPVYLDGPLEYYVSAPELFAAYPFLRQLKVETSDLDNAHGMYVHSTGEIRIDKNAMGLTEDNQKRLEELRKQIVKAENWSDKDRKTAELLGIDNAPEAIRVKAEKEIAAITKGQLHRYRDILVHEIQHAIQAQEGFAHGSSQEYFETHPVREEKFKKDYEEAIKEEYKRKKEAFDEHPELYEDFRRYEQIDKMGADEVTDENLEEMEEISDRFESAIGEKWTQYVDARRKLENARFYYYRSEVSPYSAYIRTAGEVESRNAQHRKDMTAEEKRNSLLSETEDVAEDSKIYLFDGDNGLERTGTEGTDGADGLRFSISEYSAEEVRDYVDILKPFTGTVIDRNPEDYAAYLKEHGVDIPEKDAFRFAQEAAREKMKQARKAADTRRDNWLYDNIMEYRWAVEFSGSSDFKIRVSPRFEKTEKSGTFWLKKGDSGKSIISLEELAKYVSRQTGKDELEVEEALFDFYRDLTKPILRKNYTDFKKEQFAADKEAAKQAFDEFMQQEKYRIQDEAVQVLSAGQPLTMDWVAGNRKVFNELYQMIFNKEAPIKVSQKDFEAINAALMQEGANASTYAEAYKVARANAWNEFQTKLTALRDNVTKQKADAVKLQREAVSFAEKELPKEARAEFVRDIIGLLEYSNAPSTKYPDGRRKAEFDKIIEKMTQRAGRERKESAISQIDSLLDQYKVMRTFKGIPISKVPSVQNVITEVRRLTRMTAGAVNAYVGLQTALMSQAEDGSQAWEDARKRAELAAMFGNLQFKSADEAEEALKFLTKLVTEGKAEFRQQLRERLDKIKSMRNEVVRNLSGGVIDTTGKDADRFNKYLLKNRATLESFLRFTANTKIQDFDSTVQAQLVKEYEYAQEREKTQLRLFDQDFRKAVKDILGYDGLVGWKKFLDEINAPISGVYRDVYTAEVKESGMSFPIIGKRPAIRTKVNWKIAEYALDKYADDVNMVFQKIGVSHARDIFKDYGEIKDDYAIFQVGKKFIVFSFDMDKTSVSEFEVTSQAIDRRIFVGVSVNDLSRRFVRKQTDDVSAGVKPVDPEFGNDAEDIRYQALNDLEKAAAEVEFLSDPHNLKSSREEIPDLTINRAIQLILEWEQLDYKDAFEWNGFTAETIQQLYDAVPEKYKRLAYWMRDYVNQKSDKLDEVSVKKYGVHLPRIPNYWMGAFSGSAKQRLSADNMLGAMSMNPSFLIARKGHLKAPDTNADAVAMFISHVWQQAHFIENNDAVSDLAAVFNDSKVKTAINNTLGNNVTEEILRRIKEYAAGGGTEKKSFDILKKFLSFYAPAKVGFSIPSAAKQIAGMIAYAYNMPLKDYLKYSGKTFRLSGDFKEFARFAWKSDFFQNRFAGSLDKDLVYLMNHAINSEKYSVFSSFLLDVGTIPLRGADAFAVIFGGYPVYAYTRDQALAAGKTPAEAHKAAEYAWMKATNETQQSSNVTSKNYFMANYDGVLTLFRSNAIQTMDVVLRSLDEIKLGGKTKEAKQKLARRLLISHVIIPANMFLVSQLWSKGIDVEEWNWEDLFIGMLFGSWEGLFLAEYLKKATEKIVAIAAGKPFFSPSGSAVPVLDDSIDAISKIGKLFGDKELDPSDLAAGAKSLGDILMAAGIAYTPAGIFGSVLSAAGTRARQVLRWFEDK